MKTKTKKIKKLEIKIPPKWKLAGYLYKPSKHKIYYQNYYRYAYSSQKEKNSNIPL